MKASFVFQDFESYSAIVFTNDKHMETFINKYRDCYKKENGHYPEIGKNYNLTEIDSFDMDPTFEDWYLGSF